MHEIEQCKLLSNSNGHNFTLGGPIQVHNIFIYLWVKIKTRIWKDKWDEEIEMTYVKGKWRVSNYSYIPTPKATASLIQPVSYHYNGRWNPQKRNNLNRLPDPYPSQI